SDNTSHDLNAGIEYDLGEYVPAMKGRANIGYGHYSFTDSRTQKITGTVGLSRKIDEVWSVSVDGGVIRARSTVSVSQPVPIVVGQEIVGYYLVPGQESNAGWGWVGKASLDYSGESMNGSLGYTRDLRPASGYNGAAESNALTLSAQYRLTYELSVLLTSGYYTLKSDPSQFSSQIINQKTFIVSPAVRYEFSRDVALESSYEYIKIDYPASNTSASRQVIAVRLSVQHPFFE
ncbi:MAG TPA: hypothetical protein VMH06_03450, partial [Thermodesulfovibrionales bacterium]|nr:hypothetical protein [Thermodesulfovibrionales bacterium]